MLFVLPKTKLYATSVFDPISFLSSPYIIPIIPLQLEISFPLAPIALKVPWISRCLLHPLCILLPVMALRLPRPSLSFQSILLRVMSPPVVQNSLDLILKVSPFQFL